MSPDGAIVFVTGGSDGYATVAYDAATGAERWNDHYDSTYGIANALDISSDGTTVFVSGADGDDMTTIAYDAATGIEQWTAHYATDLPNEANDIAVSPDGATVVVTGTQDDYWYGSTYQVTVAYDATDGTQRWDTLTGGDYGNGRDVEFGSDGASVFVTGQGGTDEGGTWYETGAYQTSTGTKLWGAQYDCYYCGAQALAVSADGTKVFVTGDAYLTLAYDSATGNELWAVSHGIWGGATDVGSSPNGDAVYVTGYSYNPSGQSNDYDTVAYDPTSGTELWTVTSSQGLAHDDYADALAVSPDGAKVFVTGHTTGDKSRSLTFAYDASTGDPSRTPAISHGTPSAMSVSSDGSLLIVTGSVGRYPHSDYGTVAYDLTGQGIR